MSHVRKRVQKKILWKMFQFFFLFSMLFRRRRYFLVKTKVAAWRHIEWRHIEFSPQIQSHNLKMKISLSALASSPEQKLKNSADWVLRQCVINLSIYRIAVNTKAIMQMCVRWNVIESKSKMPFTVFSCFFAHFAKFPIYSVFLLAWVPKTTQKYLRSL